MDARLTVDRKDLVTALKVLDAPKGALQGQHAVLSFEDGRLVISAGGMETALEASGHWPGRARIVGAKAVRLHRAIPPDDPLTVSVDGGFLRFGSFGVPCSWSRGLVFEIHPPLDATPGDLLRLARDHGPEEIEAAGLAEPVMRASERLEDALERAGEELAGFGLDPDELRAFVLRSIGLARQESTYLGPTQGELPLKGEAQLLLGDEQGT